MPDVLLSWSFPPDRPGCRDLFLAHPNWWAASPPAPSTVMVRRCGWSHQPSWSAAMRRGSSSSWWAAWPTCGRPGPAAESYPGANLFYWIVPVLEAGRIA